MNIEFKKIVYDNFMSIQHAELELNNNGFVSVCGVNQNNSDASSSNGAGKSVIFEGLFWCLTGSTLRGNKTIKSLFSNDGTKIELDFSVDNDEFKLVRTKDYQNIGTKLYIYVNGEDRSGKGIRESEKILNEYLPFLSTNLIGAVVILGQGLPYKFSNNSPSGRKDVLEQLSNADFMLTDLKARVQARLEYLNDETKKINNLIIQTQTENDLLKRNLIDRTDELNKLPNSYDMKKELQHTLLKLDTERSLFLTYTHNKEQEESTLKDLQLNLSGTQADYEQKVNEIRALETKSISDIESKIKFETYKKHDFEKQINEILSIIDVCPTCGQKLHGVEKPDPTQIIEKKSECEKIINELLEKKNNCINQFNEKIATLKKEIIEKIQPLNSALSFSEQTIQVTNSYLVSLSDEMDANTKKQYELESTINNYEENKKKILESINNLQVKIQDTENLLYKYNNERTSLENRLSVVTKFSNVLSRDFRGFLLRNVIDYINQQFLLYSKDMFNESNVSFELNGNNIDIMFSGKDYDSLSGGEKQKIDLIIQFSIRDMMCKFLGFSSNILVLDEMFDNLDEKSSNNALNLIINKLHDISSVYIITHHNSISIPYDKQLIVTKGGDGISRIST